MRRRGGAGAADRLDARARALRRYHGAVRLILGSLLALLALLIAPRAVAEEAPPKTVFLVLPEDPTVPTIAKLFQGFRAALSEGWAGPVRIDVEYLDVSLIDAPEKERQLRAWYLVKYRDQRPDAVVVVEADMIAFLLDLRAALWPDVPFVFAAESEDAAAALPKAPRMTGFWAHFDARGTVEAALRILPETRRVAVICGAEAWEDLFCKHGVAQLAPLRDRVEVLELFGIPVPELRKSVAQLPEDTVLLHLNYFADREGRRVAPHSVLRQLAEDGRRPIFTVYETALGTGVVGGAVLDFERGGRHLGELTLRVLRGEPAESIPPGPADAGVLAFDARALERWGIPESRLPPGAELRFREPSVWEEHRALVLAGSGTVALLAALVLVLLVERRLRVRAEREARRALGELAHMNRIAAMNELGTSIAHEINQPLAAIMANAEAARDLLAQDPPDIAEATAALRDIVEDDSRAGAVIRRLRALVRKGEPLDRVEDLAELVREVARILANDAALREAKLVVALPPGPLPIRGDAVQLQQVAINLAMNALDAVAARPVGERRVTLRAAAREDGRVELAVEDTGPGIEAANRGRIFDPFFTTKPSGMGMGLSICRSIAEAHGGSLRAEDAPGGGALFRFTLPAAE